MIWRRWVKPAAPPAGMEIIVPVCNAAGWIGVILNAYDALGVRPLFILDERSADDTGRILVGRGARLMTARGTHPRVESLLFSAIPNLRAPWILRFDDDELPSRALLDWVFARCANLPSSVAGFPRQWVWRLPSGALAGSFCAAASKAAGGSALDDRQHRLFRPDAVTLIEDLHTPGFSLTESVDAPAAAVIYHFDWLVRDHAARLKKVANYETQSPGNGTRYAAYYLPEDHDQAAYNFMPLADQTVTKICARLTPGVADFARFTPSTTRSAASSPAA